MAVAAAAAAQRQGREGKKRSVLDSPPFPAAGLKVGTHDDTVELVRRLLPGADVKAVPREVKLDMLLSGELDAVQIYDVMETVKLRGWVFFCLARERGLGCDAMRCNAMRCNAMRLDAMRCDAMRCDAMRCDAMRCDAREDSSAPHHTAPHCIATELHNGRRARPSLPSSSRARLTPNPTR